MIDLSKQSNKPKIKVVKSRVVDKRQITQSGLPALDKQDSDGLEKYILELILTVLEIILGVIFK